MMMMIIITIYYNNYKNINVIIVGKLSTSSEASFSTRDIILEKGDMEEL